MRQSLLFSKTTKEISKSEQSKSAQLLLKAGFVDKLSGGVYTFLPLGLKVLKKIEGVISEEMERIGGQRITMPGLIPKDNWLKTGRWNNFESLFKVKGKGGKEYGLGATHEEVIVPLAEKFLSSYKDLPLYIYQIQNKFRDELRAKSGLLRTREFLMKDLYSFHEDENDLDRYYEKVKESYLKIFKELGIADQTYLTLASGGTFSDYSHEFQTVTPAGEDTIYLCPKCKVALNKEMVKGEPKCWQCGKIIKEKEKAIEVANIFKLNSKFSQPFNLKFTDQEGKKKLVLMGCYGIGLPRLMGAIIEIHHDQKGMIWPESVAPFKFHLIPVEGTDRVKKEGEKNYKKLSGQESGFEVLYDDREEKTPGEKFADCDLIGSPYRIVVSEKSLSKKSVELKKRGEEKISLIKIKDISKLLSK